MDYSSGVWGFKNYNECEKIQQRTLRCYNYGGPNQIKSNQILFKVGNVHLKEKKISKKLFT